MNQQQPTLISDVLHVAGAILKTCLVWLGLCLALEAAGLGIAYLFGPVGFVVALALTVFGIAVAVGVKWRRSERTYRAGQVALLARIETERAASLATLSDSQVYTFTGSRLS